MQMAKNIQDTFREQQKGARTCFTRYQELTKKLSVF